MKEEPNPLIQDLVLSRVLGGGDHGDTLGRISQGLRSILANRDGDWKAALEQAVSVLLETGHIEAIEPEAGLKKAVKYRITLTGRERVSAFLDAEYFPAKLDWSKTLRDKYLVARALGVKIHNEQTFKALTPGCLKALILKNKLNLSLGELPTMAQARNAICWKAFGVESNKPFSAANAFAHVAALLPLVADDLQGQVTDNVLLARLTGARNPKTLFQTVVENLVFGEPAANPLVPSSEQAEALDLATFARQVQAIANERVPQGPGNVFITHLWEVYPTQYPTPPLTEAEFKQHLLSAHKQQLLALGEEDLPDQHSADLLKRSAIPHFNTTFHYLHVTPRS